ncbi:MAG: HAMP domain-containing sensor histidine kinase [Kineosporiaceae bacterium]
MSPRRRPPLRVRLGLLTAAAVFGSLTAASGASFGFARHTLRAQVDDSLTAGPAAIGLAAVEATGGSPAEFCARVKAQGGAGLPSPGTTGLVVELLGPDGTACRRPGTARVVEGAQLGTTLPPGVRVGTPVIGDGRLDDGHRARVLTVALADGWHLVAAADLSDDEEFLRRLRGVTFMLSLVGAGVALVLGMVVARAGLRPVGVLADAAEEIARTRQLDVRIDLPPTRGSDEVSRLAASFDRMTAALSAARRRQAALVADAGHELRTPLTSLRTNVDLLVRSERSGRALPPGARESLLDDLSAQVEELTVLVGELTVLAGDDAVDRPRGPVRLDAVVRAAVDRALRRAGARRIDVDVAPWTVDDADAVALERAVVNVLDNAVKFSPDGSRIGVRLVGGVVTVDDEGPGIAAPDRERVAERFWRSDAARSLPGSGLGLSIVAETLDAHGGRVEIGASPSGGARVRLHLPSR